MSLSAMPEPGNSLAGDLLYIVTHARFRRCTIVFDTTDGTAAILHEFHVVDDQGRMLSFAGPFDFIVQQVTTELMLLDARAAAAVREVTSG